MSRRHPEVEPRDVQAAFETALRSRARDTDPVQWVGVGLDERGRLLEFVAVETSPEQWLVYHAMPATKAVLNEVGLGGVVNNSWRSEDCCQVVDRKAEVRPASWANGARPTTKRDAAWKRPQPPGIIHQSPRKDKMMATYQAVNGKTFTDDDIEKWADQAESPYTGSHLGPSAPGRPVSVGQQAKPFTLRLDAARRAKLQARAKDRHTTPSQIMRDLIDAM